MNLNYFTATMAEERVTTNSNRASLEAALADDNMKKYVDLIPLLPTLENSKGRAMVETKQWYGATYDVERKQKDWPLAVRWRFCVRRPFWRQQRQLRWRAVYECYVQAGNLELVYC